MKVEEIMSKAVSIKSNETISKALVKMKQKKYHQLPVVDNEYKGMIILKKIITSDVDPSVAKVSSFVSPTAKISKNDTIENAAELLLKSGLRALPVLDGGNIVGVISETDFLDMLDKKDSIDIRNCAGECQCINKDDDIGKVKNLMVENNFSRMPILDGKKIIGVVDTLQLIDSLLKGKQSYGGRTKGFSDKGYKKSVNIDKMSATTFMRNACVLDHDSTSEEIIKTLKENEEVLFQKDGKVSILTPKDLLSHVAKGNKKGVYVEISHMDDLDEIEKRAIDSKATEFVQKIGSMMYLDVFNINIEKMHKQGDKVKYSVKTRLLTPIGLFTSHKWGWKIVTVFQDSLSTLEKEIMKAHEKKSGFKNEQKSRRMTKM